MRPRIYKEEKRVTSINVSSKLLNEARINNINVSRVCEYALADALNNPIPEIKHIEKRKTPSQLIIEALPIGSKAAIELLLKKTVYGKERIKRILREGNGVLWETGGKPDYIITKLKESE